MTFERRGGDSESGFVVVFDAAIETVRVEAWGFWPVGMATAFRDAALDPCREGKVRRIEMNLVRLKPLREEGEEAWLDILAAYPKQGVQSIDVSTNSLTKLQLLRLAKKSIAHNIVRFI